MCLGCKGNIVYGETAAERFDTWKACTMGAAVLYMAIVILTPYLVRTYLGIPTPDFWGFPALPALGIGAAFSAVTGSFLSWRSAKANSQLVRTFR